MLVIASPDAPPERIEPLREAGVDVLVVDGDPVARVNATMDELGRREITSLLVEGGAGLAGSFVDAGEVDELRLFVAPILLGGAGARPLAGGEGKSHDRRRRARARGAPRDRRRRPADHGPHEGVVRACSPAS